MAELDGRQPTGVISNSRLSQVPVGRIALVSDFIVRNQTDARVRGTLDCEFERLLAGLHLMRQPIGGAFSDGVSKQLLFYSPRGEIRTRISP